MRKNRAFSLIEIMVVVAIIGIIAAVAIPSYLKYLRRSKTIEASLNLRKLFDASVSYFMSEHSDSNGAVLAKQFPSPVGPAPAANSCCGQTGDKCKPSPTIFDQPGWSALNFAVNDPFFYWYEYQSSGQDASSQFNAIAHGNLDCDSTYSTFMRSGSVLADGHVTGGAGLFSSNEIE